MKTIKVTVMVDVEDDFNVTTSDISRKFEELEGVEDVFEVYIETDEDEVLEAPNMFEELGILGN